MLGRSFSIVTTLARTMGQAEDLVQRYGFAGHCRSIYACEVPVLELDDPASDARKLVVEYCRRAVEDDEADSIVLGCAGMADFCADVSERRRPGDRRRRRRGRAGRGPGRAGAADQHPQRVRPAAAQGVPLAGPTHLPRDGGRY